jgi:AraC-like DNA-binding protein
MGMHTQAQVLERWPRGKEDRVKFWREPRYGDLECLAARFRTHVYELHTHESYVIGTITAGCERFEVAGVQYAGTSGDLCMLNPDMVHDGRPEDIGYSYRMIYPSVGLISEMVQELTGRAPDGTPTFRCIIERDLELSHAFTRAHRALEQRHVALEADAQMMDVMARILMRYGRISAPEKPARENRAVSVAKEYLAADVSQNVDLATLAGIAGLSRTHLIRAFKKETGLPPHAFLIDRRVRLARKLLRDGEAPATVALATGFADQAHMTRAFKARIGTTPGQFARMS